MVQRCIRWCGECRCGCSDWCYRLTASGAVTGGSITDGTATIDDGAVTGVTTITGSGLATVGALDVDDVLVDGATIGHTDDTNLMTLSNGTMTVDGT